MAEQITVKLKMYTPLWTGGANGTCDRLHETGITGSMRWWYEAIVRGLDGYVPDPTGESRLELTGKEKTDAERRAKLDPASYLFGCGGWKRQFRLKATVRNTEPFCLATLDNPGNGNHWWLSEIFENSLGSKLPFGEINLSFQQLHIFDEADLRLKDALSPVLQIKALLSLITDFGAIGAKTQYGFGQFSWPEKMETAEAIRAIRNFIKTGGFKSGQNDPSWYNMKDFWLYELSLPETNPQVKRFLKAHSVGSSKLPNQYRPVSFDLRFKLPGTDKGLRQNYLSQHGKRQTRNIFGTLKGDNRSGSRVFVSHLYKQTPDAPNFALRVWGFTGLSVGQETGSELQRIFGPESVPPMKTGEEILHQEGGAQ